MKKMKLVLGAFCLLFNQSGSLKAVDEVVEEVWREKKDILINKGITTEQEIEELRNKISLLSIQLENANATNLKEAQKAYLTGLDEFINILNKAN